MTLNGVMADTLRYFTDFGKPALQRPICGGIYARVYCIFSACTTSLQRKFTFAISSPDEFLVKTYCQILGGLCHQTLTGTLPLTPLKDFCPTDPLICPPLVKNPAGACACM